MASYNHILSLMMFLRLSLANEFAATPSGEIANEAAIHIQTNDVPAETKQPWNPKYEKVHSALAQTLSLLELKDQIALSERLLALELNFDLALLKDFQYDKLDDNSEIRKALKISPGFDTVGEKTLQKQSPGLGYSFDSTQDITPTFLKDVYTHAKRTLVSGTVTKTNVTHGKDTKLSNAKPLFDMAMDARRNGGKKTEKDQIQSTSNRKNTADVVDKMSNSYIAITKDKRLEGKNPITIPHDDKNVKDSLNVQKVVRKRTFGGTSTCTMDTIQTGMTFSETIRTGGGDAVLVCRGNVLVNKCEGMCNSNVWPDVNHYDGYQKECSCCRDSSTRQRDITLSTCTIGEASVSGHFLTRPIVEPASCSCLECRN